MKLSHILTWAIASIAIFNLLLVFLNIWDISLFSEKTSEKILMSSIVVGVIFSIIIGILYLISEDKELKDKGYIN